MTEWQQVKIASLVSILNGFAFDSSNFTEGEGKPLLRIRDLKNLETEIRYSGKYRAEYLVRKGDLLVGMDGDFETVIWKGEESLLNQRVCKVTTKQPQKLSQDFLSFRIINEIKAINNIVSATTVKHLSSGDIEQIEIELPSLEEQTQIAAVLSCIDRAIEHTEALIAKQQRIKTGLMQDLLTKGIDEHGNIRSEATHEFKDSLLGRIPKEWEAILLREIVEIKHGYAFSGKYFSDQATEFILLTPGNFHINGGLYFRQSNTKYYSGTFPLEYVLQNGDVLTVMTDLTKEMAILGNTVILNHHSKVLHNQRIGKVIIRKNVEALPEFISLLMNSNLCKSNVKMSATGTTVRHTSPTKILESLVPLCSYEEQTRMCAALNFADSDISKQQAHLLKSHRVKQGLMQDLLTGKVSVESLRAAKEQSGDAAEN